MKVERRQRHPLVVWAWSLLRLKFVGIAFGALFFCLSLTPSLLPRDWVFQGLIGALLRGEQPKLGLAMATVDPQALEERGRQGDVARYAAFTFTDMNDHLRAVDVPDL